MLLLQIKSTGKENRFKKEATGKLDQRVVVTMVTRRRKFCSETCTGGAKQLRITEMSRKSFPAMDYADQKVILHGKMERFIPRMNSTEANLLIETMEIFGTAMNRANLSYFLVGGALVGSYRHHGIIPWDDDIDVCINGSHRPLLRQALGTLGTNFTLYERKRLPWKFFRQDSIPVPGFSFKWPYIDILFYRNNATHLWFEVEQFRQEMTVLISDVFPTRYRPYDRLWLPVARNTNVLLTPSEVIRSCVSPIFSHRLEKILSLSNVVPCSSLSHLYPFVRREAYQTGCLEDLIYKNKSINCFFEASHC